ncbi:MAG: O-acetyl-ADP-ribose deacetylase [Ignavibacteria bacterium]|nr:O-acetyl-ADP-ribose deacetylase [Ignavibacteria bacterium]
MNKNEIEIIEGDITKLSVEAIVNAANSSLAGGGGVDGAIHRAAGQSLHNECMEIIARQGQCPAGEAVITSGGKLKAMYVIHSVGPVWNGGNSVEASKLASAYRNCLLIAEGKGIQSIAFPNISTGIYGFPKALAAEIAIKEVLKFPNLKNILIKVTFCCYDNENYVLYNKILNK